MSASVVRDPLSTEANFAALPFPHRLVGIVALEYHPLKSRTPSICFTSPFPHSLPRSLTYPLHDTYRVTRMVMECLLLTSNSVAVLASNAKTQLTQSSQQKNYSSTIRVTLYQSCLRSLLIHGNLPRRSPVKMESLSPPYNRANALQASLPFSFLTGWSYLIRH